MGSPGGKPFVLRRPPAWSVVAALAAASLLLMVVAFAGADADRALPRGTGRAASASGRASGRAAGPLAHARRRRTVGHIGLFEGLGSWVDIYEHTTFHHPSHAVATMARHGVRTLYLETSNFNRPVAIHNPPAERRFIRAAHGHGMKVVAWYLPGFRNVAFDLHRILRAIRFRTRDGQGFDGFALDIESPVVRRAGLRTARLNTLSDRIRTAVGPRYPLGAIIPTPVGMRRNPSYWPGFPYRHLLTDYGAILPMTYFTWRVSGAKGARRYTEASVDIIRHETADAAVPIHVIGGISNDSTTAEARGFVRAVRRRHVIGASYYGFRGTTPRLWRALRPITGLPGRTAQPGR